ncbi:type VI secretion protein IcmF [Burkholderiales bacterium JOSHI_001]|nr:type VI secretion protein IcmF [Burkholderiales bacterium JOSHI_001]
MWAKLKSFFKNRWVLSAIGLLVLSLLIWFAGDAIAIYDARPLGSTGARLGLIALIILGFAAWEGFKHFRAWRANKAMLAALSGGGEASNAALSQREVAELKKRFDDALSTLKTARFEDKSGGRNFLYQLPWYMFIGAPGSGKTTALVNSGLRFPLSEKTGSKDLQIKGVGGTRNCDWWFTDEAVLLDTAGRYTTQSSNQEVDAAAWGGFLNLLKRFRPRQPLNGAIITLSVADLYAQNADERADYARSVRARIQELYKTLGQRFPLYVMVTKCDLLAGFSEFCADMGREARAQVWGMTFPFQADAKAEAAAGLFDKEFDALVDRLNLRLLTRMEEERDPQRRATIFAFPQQVAGLKGLVRSFLDEVFQSSAFSEEPMLRGVYLTSGTQEGSPIDRVLGNISRAYGLELQVLPPAASSGRSYFLTRLMRDVVFGESDLGGRSAEIERRASRIAFAGYTVLGLGTLALLAGWAVSFVRNQALVTEVAAATPALTQQAAAIPKLPAGDVRDPLPALEALNALPVAPSKRQDSVALTQRLGLYQGDKLGSQVDSSYQGLLRDAFLPRVALRLEQQVRSADSPEVRYEALKAYLMLYDPKHLVPEELEAWVNADWENDASLRADQQALSKHLNAALKRLPLEMVLPIDRNLVDETRRQLAQAPLAQRVFNRLMRMGVRDLPDFKLSEGAGPSASLAFVRASGKPITEGVSALFTRKGYDKAYLGTAKTLVPQLVEEEAWVLGPQASGGGGLKAVPKVMDDVQRLYLNEYIKAWDALLGDIRLKPTPDLNASVQLMTLLSAGDSPLRQLLQAVTKETKLATGAATSATGVAAGQIDRAASAIKERIGGLLGDPKLAAGDGMMKPEAMVEKHFEKLHQMVAGQPAPLDAVLAVLKEYEVFLRGNQEAMARGSAPQPDSMIKAKILGEADRMAPPVGPMLKALFVAASVQGDAGKKDALGAAIGGAAAGAKAALEGRYPFARGAAKEMGLDDFSNLFKPGGTLDTLVKTQLQGAIDTNGATWKALAPNGVALVKDADVANLQRASVIREAFFPGGSPTPKVQANLVLTKVEDGVGEVNITVDGQLTKLIPGANQGVAINWPSTNPSPQIRISLLLANKTEGPSASYEGSWAVFRLVDAMRQEGGDATRMVLALMVGDRKITFELRSGSVRNPLRLPELAQFKLPNG